LLARLHAHEWVVYAKQPLGGPAQVLEYLGRYTHRVAISNERIVGVDDREVRFRVRTSAQGHTKRTLAMPADTFIDRFLLHVLPRGFKRIRHYGILGPAAKAVKLAQARAALSVPAPDPVVVESVAAFMHRIDRIAWARCRGAARALCADGGDCADAPAFPLAGAAVRPRRSLRVRRHGPVRQGCGSLSCFCGRGHLSRHRSSRFAVPAPVPRVSRLGCPSAFLASGIMPNA
jgi:hypothetical protein